MDRNESDTENDQIARTLAEAVQDIFYTPQELAARLAELKARSDSSPPLPTAAHRAQDLQAQEAGPGESLRLRHPCHHDSGLGASSLPARRGRGRPDQPAAG